MVQETLSENLRINARKTDAFDIFNLKHYTGPNPYLNQAALVFDFALTGHLQPLPLVDYLKKITQFYPHLAGETYQSYAHLFARTVTEVGKLDMDLHLDQCAVKSYPHYVRIAVQTLHARTGRSVIYFVWDWFEAITQNQEFELESQIKILQNIFRNSAYGGPTVYTLWRTAYEKKIPVFYLWDEGLVQYGYGKKQVRGIATTFDCDSHLDSDFTTRKDDCKSVLATLGFPVPIGEIVSSQSQAISAAKEIGFPVAVKPVAGHKGIGVTAGVQDTNELIFAFERAKEAIPEGQPIRIIIEKSLSGADFRLLCVNGRFIAATERRPASVTGDGSSTISELIERENRTPARLDTPTSPLSKIQCDESMQMYLEEQNLTLDSVIEKNRIVYLRKVANLSAGGVSIDATRTVHPDNIILAQDIAQYFRLTCLGIDVMTPTLSKSWKEGNFGILEINSAPGISMHLRPAVGESIHVGEEILKTFFASEKDARIPIITFNRISVEQLQEIIDHILLQHPDLIVGAVCHQGTFVNRSLKNIAKTYNAKVQNLLRHPKLDLLIAEYPDEILETDGMFYDYHNMVILDQPTETELMLARDLQDDAILIIKNQNDVTIRRKGLIEQYQLGDNEPFSRVYLKEIGTIF